MMKGKVKDKEERKYKDERLILHGVQKINIVVQIMQWYNKFMIKYLQSQTQLCLKIFFLVMKH